MKYGHWEYSKEFNINDYIGFVYIITNLINDKKYIGKKLLNFATSKQPKKGKINKRRGFKPSDWQTYTGSCNQLNEDISKLGKNNFKFEIINLYKTKTDLNYAEMKQIIIENNRVTKSHLSNENIWLLRSYGFRTNNTKKINISITINNINF